MFFIALAIGIYSYLIFFLGIFKLLYIDAIFITTILYLFSLILLAYKKGVTFTGLKKYFIRFPKEKVLKILLWILIAQIIVNFIGALGPEIGFDSLWYHLTLPKVFLSEHAIFHIPGGLLYYSDMPKLMEMLYISTLAFGNEITAKVLHFILGILCCIALYALAKRYFNPKIALIAVVIFYSNLVVGWVSITAYNDLTRTFFEILALTFFIEWWQKHTILALIKSALMVGLAIATKLLAVTSLFIFVLLIGIGIYKHKKNVKILLYSEGIFIFSVLLIPMPWLLFSYINTNNPVYPIFSNLFHGIHAKIFDLNLLNPLQFVHTFWHVFTQANDPISPLYLILLPLIILFFPKFSAVHKIFYIYSLIAFLFWYATSQVEGPRLLIPYLPAFSMLCAFVIYELLSNKKIYSKYFSVTVISVVIFVSVISIVYRGIANSKYIPVLTGQQSKQEFLTNELNFDFGDFYDTDNYFAKNISPDDTVLLFGFHNLYYINFSYIDASWVKKGDEYNYVALQNTTLPKRFKDWQLVYTNNKTLVKLYKPSLSVHCNKKCVY